ncbi:MAG: DUF983 domain-containing protein [Flavobacterium sp.]|nr:MAG: DUF983 domain-containing protein [Flavobacterium sp.]
MKRTSKLYAIVKGRCPQCRRGAIFTGSVFGFNLQKTNSNCENCGLRFEIEPGYFYAAMYVSYAMNMAEMISLGFATYYISGGKLDFEDIWLYVGVIVVGSIILSPFNYRYSRIMLLHLLSPKIKYKPSYDTAVK